MLVMMRRVQKAWAPPPKLTTTEWADRYRYLAAESSALPGKYNSKLTPWVAGMHDALDDPHIYKVVCIKSAQVAWTDGVINNWIGRKIDIDPSPIIGLFSKSDAAKEYGQEKLAPMVMATPRLRDKIDVATSRKDGNRALFKKFAGGFLKLVGSNSPSNVKSTPAPCVFVEEPDDAAINVGKQGDAIKLLEERTKTYHRRKIVFGGTPSVKGLSTIEDAYLNSDQRKFFIPCHACGESHVLHWDNVKWDGREGDAPVDKETGEITADRHEVYGYQRPETASYECPHCNSLWDDHAKNRSVRLGEWRATAEARGVAGFYINEIYSPFPGSRLGRLVERYLEAQHKLDQGDDTDMIVFTNSALGLAYEYASDAPDLDELEAKALEYPELESPAGGLIVTAGVDIQHDRIAIVLRVWGRGEESWLLYWGEIYGNTVDKNDPVWRELDGRLFAPIKHENGMQLMASAISIDSSDGTTSDAVYHYVRSRQQRGVMAVKGSSNDYGTREIFSRPKAVDTKGRNNSKASRHGLRVYMVGTHKAKDLIGGRMKLNGHGPGRMHWYQDVRADYYKQLTGEVKAPHRSMRNKKVWQRRAGAAVEAWDCEVYALHAARSLRVHVMSEAQWQVLENKLVQSDLFSSGETQTPENNNSSKSSPSGGSDWINSGSGDWIR
jgi:phage terminase large subunit GpA-like protein